MALIQVGVAKQRKAPSTSWLRTHEQFPCSCFLCFQPWSSCHLRIALFNRALSHICFEITVKAIPRLVCTIKRQWHKLGNAKHPPYWSQSAPVRGSPTSSSFDMSSALFRNIVDFHLLGRIFEYFWICPEAMWFRYDLDLDYQLESSFMFHLALISLSLALPNAEEILLLQHDITCLKYYKCEERWLPIYQFTVIRNSFDLHKAFQVANSCSSHLDA